ncbi:MAG: hypothetical protein ACRDL7_15305 [Gaiellaceae bacterium]
MGEVAENNSTRLDATGRPIIIIPGFGEQHFSHPIFEEIKAKAEGLKSEPLPSPFDNRDYGFEGEE